MNYDVKLQSPEGKHPLDENLRPLKIGDASSSLELAQHGSGARVTGGLEVSGIGKSIVAQPLITNNIVSTDLTINDSGDITLSAGGHDIHFSAGGTAYLSWSAVGTLVMRSAFDTSDVFQITVGSLGATVLTTVDDAGSDADLTLNIDGLVEINSASGENIILDSGGDINLKPNGNDVFINDIADTGENIFRFNVANSYMRILDDSDVDNYFQIIVADEGATTLSTVDADTAVGHLTLDVDGDIILKPAGNEVWINDGSNDIIELNPAFCRFTIKDDAQTTNYMQIVVADHGETSLFTVDADAAIAHLNFEVDGHVEFDGCAVGFDLQTVAGAASVTVDFRLGNKVLLTFGDGNITSMNTIFPATSGNFVLLLKQDATGGRTLTNYKAFDSTTATAAGAASFKFAGGSDPTLTTDANHVDIISIFWDADNEIAYAVTTLDFQF
mgnify:CR=1 FL=1